MTRNGREYEQFVYDKLRRLFVDSRVTPNDKIMGIESGIEREIDISIKTAVGAEELLYIVQCKDRRKRPADIVILGEFSSVIRDVRAAKGFLLCTSGFARSNHQYARELGIELVTVEDINSETWKADVEIPLVYVRKMIDYLINAAVVANEELVEKNRDQDLVIHFDVSSAVSTAGGQTFAPISDYIAAWLETSGTEVTADSRCDLSQPNLRIKLADVWLECSALVVTFSVARRVYLKYLTPEQYSHIRDHVRDTTLPLHVVLSGTFPILDDTFVEVAGGEVPVFPSLYAKVEEWTDIEKARGDYPH
jgi:Restriction endonuclease